MKSIFKTKDFIRQDSSKHLLVRSMLMILLLFGISFFKCCIVPYIPEPLEDDEMLVVEGLITDRHEVNVIKLSRSHPLWRWQLATPISGSMVWISDDLNKIDTLKEKGRGIFLTDSTKFQGKIGRKYTLHIRTKDENGVHNYESLPVEMKRVPPIDNLYYEKKDFVFYHIPVQGCQIYLDTHDPQGTCNFYRWKYTETWEFHLPFDVPNKVCWISQNSTGISIKNSSLLSESRINRQPLLLISNPVDRLSIKYSILVDQYSLNEDEYLYWERLKNTLEQVGGLYDVIPASIPNNLFSVENPDEKILGYFSVSAVSSRRLFIVDQFTGPNLQYMDCIQDTIYGTAPIEGLTFTVWILIDQTDQVPPRRIVTYHKTCGDCESRGTIIKPAFWDDNK